MDEAYVRLGRTHLAPLRSCGTIWRRIQPLRQFAIGTGVHYGAPREANDSCRGLAASMN